MLNEMVLNFIFKKDLFRESARVGGSEGKNPQADPPIESGA